MAEEQLNEKTDLKYLGAILLALATGNQDIEVESEEFDLQSELSLSNVSDQCKDLIFRLILGSPGERVTVAKCLRHPWLNSSIPPQIKEDQREEVIASL